MKSTHTLSSLILILVVLSIALTGCQSAPPAAAAEGKLDVLAVETFLADIAQNVSGERASVSALIPSGMDPHAFEPGPKDVARIAEADVIIANGGGVEGWLENILANSSGSTTRTILASAGLASRQPSVQEAALLDEDERQQDPHFWLDPISVIHYVENIRDGLTQADPEGEAEYARNADAYIIQLHELDGWIKAQIEQIPAERRLLVTNHESFGYYADRYGLRITGAVLPSVSTDASPSARQMADLVEHIRSTHSPAIFLETGANPDLAEQIAQEAGVKLVTDLYTHSTTAADGPAPTYIDMMKANTTAIVDALK